MNKNTFTRQIFCGTLMLVAVAAVAVFGQTPEPAASDPYPALSSLSLGRVFTYLMVTLGPIKLLAPFVNITKGMERSESRSVAVKGFLIALIAGLVAAIVGQSILSSWHISMPALLIATGLVLLLVALKAVLSQYKVKPIPTANAGSDPVQQSTTLVALSPLAFPNIITPYGSAAFILLLSAAAPGQAFYIFGVFVVVMIMNLVTMLFARPILKYGAGVFAILGSVLSVLQVALAVQILLIAGRMIGLLPQT